MRKEVFFEDEEIKRNNRVWLLFAAWVLLIIWALAAAKLYSTSLIGPHYQYTSEEAEEVTAADVAQPPQAASEPKDYHVVTAGVARVLAEGGSANLLSSTANTVSLPTAKDGTLLTAGVAKYY